MSSTVTSPALWTDSMQNVQASTDAGPSNSRPKRIAARRSNGRDDRSVSQKSLSPAPARKVNYLRITRPAREALSASPEERTPAEAYRTGSEASDRPPQVPVTRSAKSANTSRGPSPNDSQHSTSTQAEIIALPERSSRRAKTGTQSLTPDPAIPENTVFENQEPLGAREKRKSPDDDAGFDTVPPPAPKQSRRGSTTRSTPEVHAEDYLNQVSTANRESVAPTSSPPAEDAPATEVVQPEVQSSVPEAPKRAPRKKRKWLKRGEVDPDDPVAVARQKERHMLLDQADQLLLDQIDSVHDGAHDALASLFSELDRRKDLLLERAEARNQHDVQNLKRMRDHAVQQANANFQEEKDQLLELLRTDLRHFKHRIINERSQLAKTHSVLVNPLGKEYRAGRPWGVYNGHLLSENTERTFTFERDGGQYTLRQHGRVGPSASRADTQDDLRIIRAARAAVRGRDRRSPSPVKHTSRSKATTSGDSNAALLAGRRDFPPSRFPPQYPPKEKSADSGRKEGPTPAVASSSKPTSSVPAQVPKPREPTNASSSSSSTYPRVREAYSSPSLVPLKHDLLNNGPAPYTGPSMKVVGRIIAEPPIEESRPTPAPSAGTVHSASTSVHPRYAPRPGHRVMQTARRAPSYGQVSSQPTTSKLDGADRTALAKANTDAGRQ